MKRPASTAATILLSAALLVLALSAGASAETRVIVNQGVEVAAISQAEISRIYLGKKTFWDSGARIEPSLLASGDRGMIQDLTAAAVNAALAAAERMVQEEMQRATGLPLGSPPVR
jgi:hypothetical protein